jgi:hypothetical protein
MPGLPGRPCPVTPILFLGGSKPLTPERVKRGDTVYKGKLKPPKLAHLILSGALKLPNLLLPALSFFLAPLQPEHYPRSAEGSCS